MDDFDADTPPPRRRPIGDPVPPFVTLPPGEPVVETFKDWDRKGRIPAGSVLCEHVGTALGMNGHSGYRVAAETDQPNRSPLGQPWAIIPADILDRWRVAVVIQEAKRAPSFVVMSPR